MLDPLGKQMDIFLETVYALFERLPFGLLWSNTCLRDGYRTRRVLKCILEAHFMRSAVPVLVILSLTHANPKYRKNLVSYTFWLHYRTNFVETKLFSHYSDPSCGLQSVVNARLPGNEYSVCGIRTAVLKDTAHSLCGSGTVELQVTEYSVCGSGTSSHRIFCV